MFQRKFLKEALNIVDIISTLSFYIEWTAQYADILKHVDAAWVDAIKFITIARILRLMKVTYKCGRLH
jgi:hypothetical protein